MSPRHPVTDQVTSGIRAKNRVLQQLSAMPMASDCDRDRIRPTWVPPVQRDQHTTALRSSGLDAIWSHCRTAAPSSCHSSTVGVFALSVPS